MTVTVGFRVPEAQPGRDRNCQERTYNGRKTTEQKKTVLGMHAATEAGWIAGKFTSNHTHGVGTRECWGDLSNSPFGWVSHSFSGNIGKPRTLRPPGQERTLWPGSQGEGSCSPSGERTAILVSLVPFGRGWKLQPLIV